MECICVSNVKNEITLGKASMKKTKESKMIIIFMVMILTCSCKDEIEDARHVELRNMAISEHGMVAGLSEGWPVRAGIEVLKEGGNAIDAVFTTVLAQIVMSAGSAYTFAGTMSLLYYDATTNRVYSMGVPWRYPQEENDPLNLPPPGSLDGRTALVSGFMRGVEEAHQRFGVKSFSRIFAPAIDLAENGFKLGSLAYEIEANWNILSRLPETKKVFTNFNGSRYKEGDLFKQPELAKTLRNVAAKGADYMFTGAWAQKFINTLRSLGGKVTYNDLVSYQVNWNEPTNTTFGKFDIYSAGLPAPGGINLIEAFNLLENSQLGDAKKHYSQSADLLYQFIKISRVGSFFTIFPYRSKETVEKVSADMFPHINFSKASRQNKETALLIWEKIKSKEWNLLEQKLLNPILHRHTGHTNIALAVDEDRNVAVVVHTINTSGWGRTGIFIDGVSISDIGIAHRYRMYKIGVGGYADDDLNPVIILKNGSPFLVCGATGTGLHSETLQHIYNIIKFDWEPQQSQNTIRFYEPILKTHLPHGIPDSGFTSSVISGVKNQGQPLEPTIANQYWGGIKINAQDQLQGSVCPYLISHVEGY